MNFNNPQMPAILIVDDDGITQNLLACNLKPDYCVSTCDSEEKFYEILENNKIDLILMDLTIRGEKKGLSLIKEIKASPKFSKIPVICLSAHTHAINQRKIVKAGADFYLLKPVDKKILLNKIVELLN